MLNKYYSSNYVDASLLYRNSLLSTHRLLETTSMSATKAIILAGGGTKGESAVVEAMRLPSIPGD